MTGVPAHRLKQAKRALRRDVIARRDALAEGDRAAWSEAIAERLTGLPEVADARTVMAFWSFGSEVDTAPLLRRLHDAGTRVVLPRVEGTDVVAVVFASGDAVAPTAFGAMEPTSATTAEPDEIDLVVVPGVAFDRGGWRVGYGGGFYDRYLPRTRPTTRAIAIAFSMQVVDEVPHGAFDRPVDAIVTEREVIVCRP